MQRTTEKYNKRDFWIQENQKYAEPHFRLTKAARLINKIAGDSECDLLDVGCGPATLMQAVRPNVNYYGIDIAIHHAAPNLREFDFIEKPIAFDNKQFDIIIAQGVFEYIGSSQSRKFSEIARLLRADGRFIASYVNFGHRDVQIYAPYNNVRTLDEFTNGVSQYFEINELLPTSHHWHHHEPNRAYMKTLQMHINVNIPILSRFLAVEYFFICCARK